MDSALTVDRLHFAFTVTFHYIFPQLTMGLALLLVILKVLYVRTGEERYNSAARFWAKIFGITFLFGVVTGIPMEFQFGTNWSRFSNFAGGVIGQTLAMEGVFAFFLESSFLGLFLFGEKRLGKRGHLVSAILVCAGSWLSGFFIIATDAWMQHPVAYAKGPDGHFYLTSFWGLIFNPWAGWQYFHNMGGAVITGSFVMTAVGAFYVLTKRHTEDGRIFLRVGVITGLIFTVIQVFPTGDGQGRMIAEHQPTTLAAMEGIFKTEAGAPLVIIGQPDLDAKQLDNPLRVPNMLSILTYRRWEAEVKGLDAFDPSLWPDNISLLYYSYHVMVGLGTIFIAIMLLAGFWLWRKRLFAARWLLWIVMLSFPFPFIANTAGWITAEVGRQPWLVYGLMRTSDGYSPLVSAGNGLFTLLGFMGMYMIMGMLYLFLIFKEIEHGPAGKNVDSPATADQPEVEPAN
ncbi:MAG: cytochrome ubiquinol oxidase subunit I [Blastocatellia bacterium]